MQFDIFRHVIHWHWCQHHVMPIPPLMVPLHLPGEDNQIMVCHGICGNVIPLVQVSSSHGAEGIVNDTSAHETTMSVYMLHMNSMPSTM